MDSESCCAMCPNDSSVHCHGCILDYCSKCIEKHLKLLKGQLKGVMEDGNLLEAKLKKLIKSDEHFINVKGVINKWEEDTVLEIRKTANAARMQLETLAKKEQNDISKKFQKFSEDLAQLNRDGNYHEKNLAEMRTRLKSLDNDLYNFKNFGETITIENETNKIVWKDLLYIDVKKNAAIDSKSSFPLRYLSRRPIKVCLSKNGTTIIGDLENPVSIAVDQEDDTIFVADRDNHQIVSWNHVTNSTRVVVSHLQQPTCVAMDRENNAIIIADKGKRTVLRWSLQNKMTQPETIIEDIDCYGVAIDSRGSLYVSDTEKDEVRKFTRGSNFGNIVAGGKGNGNRTDQLNSPTHIALGKDGSLYICDWGNHRIMRWKKRNRNGTIVAGGNGKGSQRNQLHGPSGLFVDFNDNLYIADTGNNRVLLCRKGKKRGKILVAGTEVEDEVDQSKLAMPISLALDAKKNLYVVDCGNNRVQRFEIKENFRAEKSEP